MNILFILPFFIWKPKDKSPVLYLSSVSFINNQIFKEQFCKI